MEPLAPYAPYRPVPPVSSPLPLFVHVPMRVAVPLHLADVPHLLPPLAGAPRPACGSRDMSGTKQQLLLTLSAPCQFGSSNN